MHGLPVRVSRGQSQAGVSMVYGALNGLGPFALLRAVGSVEGTALRSLLLSLQSLRLLSFLHVLDDLAGLDELLILIEQPAGGDGMGLLLLEGTKLELQR